MGVCFGSIFERGYALVEDAAKVHYAKHKMDILNVIQQSGAETANTALTDFRSMHSPPKAERL
jgi:hypothetical protein